MEEDILEKLELLKKAGCKMVKCKVVDKNIELNKKIIELKNNSIPISVIQNKLEKYKREFDFYADREHFEWQDGEFDGEQCDDIALKIGVLKELLEERNE